MPNMRAEILTAWTGSGAEEDANRPQIGDDYPLLRYQDTTGQPSANLHPDPNLFVAQIECTDVVLDQIEADADYMVLWSEEIVEDAI